MKTRVKDLTEQGDKLFSQRSPLLSLWQVIAEQFYVERANFTRQFSMGEEFASHLMTGAPVMARRDLANQFHAMLRPRQKPWFHARTQNNRVNEDAEALKWLDRATDIQRTFMYEPPAQFVRATSQGDHDFAAFGQCIIRPSVNRTKDGLLYQNDHLRDTVWSENAELVIDTVHRKWKPTARQLMKLFPKTVSGKLTDTAKKDPNREIECRHIVVPSDEYDLGEANKRKAPFVSIYIDSENESVLEEVPFLSLGYVIPRWQTVSGSQYAYSPSTVIALPDARLLQQITLTLLESGQKAVDPPMIAVAEAIQGGANLGAGMITWADAEYDERLGEVLRPAYGPGYGNGLNWGVDREERIMKAIHDAFYLNQISLPEIGKDMTAYETQKRVEEYVRRALPLFEPMETEYNGALCNETFDILMRNGAFGPRDDIPDVLRGQEIRFVFDSPLQAATDRSKADALVGAANLLATIAPIDPTVRVNMDWDKAFREALPAVGVASDWIIDEDMAQQAKAAAQQHAAMQNAAGMVQQGADIATSVGQAGQSLQAAGLTG